ncbi:MAG: MarR family transcriptional regulator [Pseudonocardia sediminis]
MHDVRAGLSELVAAVDGYRNALSVRYRLGVADMNAIGLLLDEEPLRAARIARRCGLTAGSGTALLDRLEARGYLSRTRPADNRRVIEVTLTEAGRALGHALRDPVVPGLTRVAEQGPGADQVAGVLRAVAGCLEMLTRETEAGAPDEDPSA